MSGATISALKFVPTPVPTGYKKVEHWPLELITPYRKCYGIDPDEFASYRGGKGSDIFHGVPGQPARRGMWLSTHQLERVCPCR